MRRRYSAIIISGLVALLAIFVLLAFARSLVSDTVFETRLGYELAFEQELAKQKLNLSQTSDPLVTKSDLVTSALGIPAVLETDPLKGPSQAQLTIIEYGDFECSFCAQLAPVLDEVLAEHDQVRVVWKDLPNPAHLQARQAANAARCAQAQGKFWPYHDLLFANQDNLGPELYLQIAEVLELELSGFSSCLGAQTFDALASQGLSDANTYNIDATPYLFVGRQRLDRLVSLPELQTIINQELQR